MTWYEFDKARLVLEYFRVKAAYPQFVLKKTAEVLYWEGKTTVAVAGDEADPLHLKVTYPESFPVGLPIIEAISPTLDPTEVGHAWHRWPLYGNICFVKPPDWNISSTADEVISKAVDWYFNYVAVKRGLVSAMPEIGRAVILNSKQHG